MTESYKKLYKKLRDSEFGCVPAGFHETEDVYSIVYQEYTELCNDSILCRDTCSTDSTQPEWKHRIRTVQQDLLRNDDSSIKQLSNGWYYQPSEIDIAAIPDNPLDFEVSQKYNRWELHNEFGGQRYRGIATPSEDPLIFIFTGGSGENYGYDDEFLDDGSFLYSGEGTEGDMTMEGGNEALRVHKEREESVHLFEETEYPWIVTYAGEYEYDGHQWDTLPDENGENRDGIRFRLVPVGGTEIHIDAGPASSLSEEELFEKAKQSSPTGPPTSGVSSSNSSTDRHLYKRSDIVKDFALRVANGVCQGCEEPAPFVDGDDDPFLEVHHIQRLSDDGPDDPENVIAVCPNCHRRVHYGRDGDEFDRELKQKAETRNEEFQASD